MSEPTKQPKTSDDVTRQKRAEEHIAMVLNTIAEVYGSLRGDAMIQDNDVQLLQEELIDAMRITLRRLMTVQKGA
jgi:hypothetical protein